jgi:heat shock protein HtpX
MIVIGGRYMAMFKRIFLFLIVNMLIMVTISIVLNVLGVRPYLNAYGIDYQALLAFCAVWGFSGALISLAISRWMAKTMMGVKVIDPQNPGSQEARELVSRVHKLAAKASLPAMPEVGYYDSPEVNAFATGPSKSRSLVAVSTGLLNNMDREAVEGVLGHEVSHIANGDMVTMTLLQGLVNTFVLFFSKIAAWALSNAMSGNRDREDRGSPWVYYLSEMVFQILFSLLGMFVVAWFSRRREYRADAGSASIGGREKMVHALQSLKRSTEMIDDTHPAVANLKIAGRRTGILALLSTHPDLDDRINALRNLA